MIFSIVLRAVHGITAIIIVCCTIFYYIFFPPFIRGKWGRARESERHYTILDYNICMEMRKKRKQKRIAPSNWNARIWHLKSTFGWNNTETERPNKRHKCETKLLCWFVVVVVVVLLRSFSLSSHLFILYSMPSLLFVGNLFLAVQSIIKQNMTRCSFVVAIITTSEYKTVPWTELNRTQQNQTKPNSE